MVWGLSDRFVNEVIAFYPSKTQAARALQKVIHDEPEWEGMLEVVLVPERRREPAPCRGTHRPRGGRT